ncbi:hypothetical protein MMC11_003926 [Xylographa trunciseda]|nr:hypothetical protein [Xylographa trunciseda]
MATDVQQTPFVKQLASSDRPTREKALDSLRTYLTSSRPFTDLELLKLWKGLFFCMWHSDRPIPQQRLALALSHLLLPLPTTLFMPFLTAFWTTISREWTSIDALRMDKFMRLVRGYVNAAFTYLSNHEWDSDLLDAYLFLVEAIPLSPGNLKVGDGLRYHVLDVWVEELSRVDGKREGQCPVEDVMRPVRRLEKDGRTKKVRERAGECLADDRLKDWRSKMVHDDVADNESGKRDESEDEEDEWDGLDD